MRGRQVLQCWMTDRWVPYPIQVPAFRAVAYEAFSDISSILNASDYVTTVWIGPAAPFPLRPERIQLPRAMSMKCDWFTATDEDAREYLTRELLDRHPEISTAYLYETIIPDRFAIACTLVWKVWIHGA